MIDCLGQQVARYLSSLFLRYLHGGGMVYRRVATPQSDKVRMASDCYLNDFEIPTPIHSQSVLYGYALNTYTYTCDRLLLLLRSLCTQQWVSWLLPFKISLCHNHFVYIVFLLGCDSCQLQCLCTATNSQLIATFSVKFSLPLPPLRGNKQPLKCCLFRSISSLLLSLHSNRQPVDCCLPVVAPSLLLLSCHPATSVAAAATTTTKLQQIAGWLRPFLSILSSLSWKPMPLPLNHNRQRVDLKRTPCWLALMKMHGRLVFDGSEAKSRREFQPREKGWLHPTQTKSAVVLECLRWPVITIQENWMDKEVLHQQKDSRSHRHGQMCCVGWFILFIHSYFWTCSIYINPSTKFLPRTYYVPPTNWNLIYLHLFQGVTGKQVF